MLHITDNNTDIFMKAYRSFLAAEGEMSIDQVTCLYQNMQPALHKNAVSPLLDIEAFVYSLLRLPDIVENVDKIILAQTEDIFIKAGYDILLWEEVSASARRRKMFYDGKSTLALFINSVTDVDDIVCLLTAFQLEWNKIHERLQKNARKKKDVPDEKWEHLKKVWRDGYKTKMEIIKKKPLNMTIRLLKGSYIDYERATQKWLEHILHTTQYKDLIDKPIYFVSSNTHSLVNSITGWVTEIEDELIAYLKKKKLTLYLDYWKKINKGEHPGSKENFLWYILKKYEKENPEVRKKRIAFEHSIGIDYIDSKGYLDIDAQVISMQNLIKSNVLKKFDGKFAQLTQSDAYILNIDYPLGFGAYIVLSTILKNSNSIKGIYILGKASFLHGNLGDIGLANTVYDMYSKNTYIFQNAFTAEYLSSFKSGSVLKDQRSVSSNGTLLHPEAISQKYFLNDYTIIEMEDGPYLDAIYETTKYKRYPEEETISLLGCPIDIGIIHYASDTPYTKAITLGTRNLGYEGVEATYVSSLAILTRILENESKNTIS